MQLLTQVYHDSQYNRTFFTQFVRNISSNNIIKVQNRNFKNRMTSVFSDCPSVVEKIKNEELDASRIKFIVEEFNKCNK